MSKTRFCRRCTGHRVFSFFFDC